MATFNREVLFEAAILNAQDAIMITEAEPIDCPGPLVVYVNPAFTRMTGYTLDEIQGHSPRILQGAKTDRRELDKIRKALKEWKPIRAEFTNYRKDGSEFQVELNISPIANEKGWFTHWVSVQRDITDRTKQERLIRESEEHFQILADTAPILIWESGVDKGCHYFNKSWLDFVGRKLEQEIGNGWAENVHPEDYEACLKTYVSAFDQRTPFEMEYRLKHVSGTHRWVLDRGKPRFNTEGFFQGYIGTCVDIHDLRLIEGALRKSEERYRRLTESLPQLIWTCDPSGFCDYLSPQWCAYTGVPAEQHYGNGWQEAIHPEDRDRCRNLWELLLQQKAQYDLEYRLRRFDGSYRWFKTFGICVRDAQGQPHKIFGSCTEITEIVAAREAMTKRSDELEDLVEVRTATLRETVAQLETFSHSISHDLRAPLRAIQGYATVLTEELEGKLSPDLESYLHKITLAGSKMERLIRDILAYSKVSQGNIELSEIDLDPFINEILQQYGQDLEGGVDIEVQETLGNVQGNPSLLTQAVSNLITNAIKFRSSERPLKIKIWSEFKGDRLVLFIEDNGIGISPQYHDQIWQIFSRANPDPKYDGAGIGLAVVYKAMQSMRGSVGVDSDGVSGSRFWMNFMV